MKAYLPRYKGPYVPRISTSKPQAYFSTGKIEIIHALEALQLNKNSL